MTRKLWSCVLALGLLAAACGSKGAGSQAVKVSFLPQTVDFLDDVGRGLSLAVDQEGNPHLTYIGLIPQLKAGEIAPARPIDAPALPAVLTADLVNGIWSRGFVVQTDITKANGAKVPVSATDSTATAIDSKDVQHVVWTQFRGLWYSSRQLGQQVGQFSKPTKPAVDGYISGASLAVGPDETPWAAYYVNNTVQVASLHGRTWTTQDVDSVGQCSACPALRTAVAVTSSGPVVAYTDPATHQAMVATSVFGSWSTQPVQASGSTGGFGVSLALDGQVPVVSFVSESGQVFVARQTSVTAWQATQVGSFQASGLKDLGGGTAVAVDPRKHTVYVAWADPVANQVKLVRGTGADLHAVTTPGTQLGEFPAAQVSKTGKLNLAWYDSVDQDLLLGTYPESLGLFAVPSPSSSASPTSTTVTACKPTETGTSLKLVAKNTSFDTDCLGAPAGQGFQIVFDNQDASVPHNVEVYTSASATTRVGGATSATDTITGVASVTYNVPGLQPGNYYFRCDVHPTVMFGTLVVK